MAWLFGMGALSSFSWKMLLLAAAQGGANLVAHRLGWVLLLTFLGASLSAGPSGAYAVLVHGLTHLPEQPEAIRLLVMRPLLLGQGCIVLCVLPWLAYALSSVVHKGPMLFRYQAVYLMAMLSLSAFSLFLLARVAGLLMTLDLSP
jgi:hypothetical protein